jgi:cytochrome c biogenesis protein CcdA
LSRLRSFYVHLLQPTLLRTVELGLAAKILTVLIAVLYLAITTARVLVLEREKFTQYLGLVVVIDLETVLVPVMILVGLSPTLQQAVRYDWHLVRPPSLRTHADKK